MSCVLVHVGNHRYLDVEFILFCCAAADKFEIKADVPGLSKQDIKLNVDADVLSISVEKAQEKKVSPPPSSLLPPLSCRPPPPLGRSMHVRVRCVKPRNNDTFWQHVRHNAAIC